MTSVTSLDSKISREVFECISHKDYSSGIDIIDKFIEKENVLSCIQSIMSCVEDCLPSTECTILSSSDLSHPSLSGSLYTINDPSQFIVHTNDSNPWVVIDFGRTIARNYPIFLYNRCQSEEISKRLLGCSFYTSVDKGSWESIRLDLTRDEVYEHKGIRIERSTEYRYLRIDRPNCTTPIHLSQVTLGRPLIDIEDLTHFCNMLFAKVYNLQTSDHGRIIEHKRNKCYLSFRSYSCHDQVSLAISGVGRFANLLIQVTNALLVARQWRINHIYIPYNSGACDLFPNPRVILCKNYPITINVGQPPKGIVIEGRFFYRHDLQISKNEYPGLRTLVDEFRDHCELDSTHKEDSLRTLTIHIRSGDIFSESAVHPGYGQPPLAFYQESISHYNPDRVILVYENSLNPVINPLIRYLNSLSVQYKIQSSTNLRGDIEALINARALAVGFGTFARGVICFNSVLETVYTFNGMISRAYLPQKSERPLSTFAIYDRKGEYIKAIMSNNWFNTPEQRDLMISYPREHMVLKDQ